MTSGADPLDDLVRRGVDAVPVPAGLEARIRASVARRERRRLGLGLAAVAAAVMVGSVVFTLLSRTDPPPMAGPVVPLSDPALRLELNETQLTTSVASAGDGLVFRFAKGGSSDE